MPARVINDEPWGTGLSPLSVRGVDEDGEWLHGARARIEPVPDEGLYYETRERLKVGWYDLDRYAVQFNALVPPGTYQVHFVHERHSPTYTVEVKSWLNQLSAVPFAGHELIVREGTWDEYVVKENSYAGVDVRPSDVVLDVGAHVGTFACRAMKIGAYVIAYEPDERNQRILNANLSAFGREFNRRGTYLTHRQAVIDEEGVDSVRLWIDAAGDGDERRTALHSTVRTKGARLATRVSATSWRQALEYKPNVLKVDVEGSELTYDWTLVPSSVREIAVEIENAGKKKEMDRVRVRREIEGLGFSLVKETSGWSTVQLWRR